MKVNKLIPLILLLLILPSFIGILRHGSFPIQDDLQAFRIYEMGQCFTDYQFPCRWVPDAGYGYGYPLFNYYSPSVYYLGELIHLLGFQIVDTVNILFVLGFLAAGFFMYFFLESLFDSFSALVGAVLYIYIPFRAVEVYVRGSLSEFWALAFFPLILWSISLYLKKPVLKNMLFISISISLLLLTHNLMSMIFAPIIVIWTITEFLLKKTSWKILPGLLLSGIWGVGLASFFVLPVAFEKQYVHLETLLGGYFGYQQHFVTIFQLFISNHWGYGSSKLGPNDDLSLSAGQVQIIMAILAFILAVVSFKRKQKLALTVFVIGICEAIVLFLMHEKSSFIWQKIPFLAWLQFPWRFLGISSFLLSLLSSAAVFLIKSPKFKFTVGFLAITSVFILHLEFFAPKNWIVISDSQKFSSASWERQLTTSIFDYLPIYAKLPPLTKAPNTPEILNGNLDINSFIKGSDYQILNYNAKDPVLIRMPLFDFPGMKVFIDGSQIHHTHNNCQKEKFCLGLITFRAPSGKHIALVKLEDTPIRMIGNIVSLISLGFLIIAFFVSKRLSYFIPKL